MLATSLSLEFKWLPTSDDASNKKKQAGVSFENKFIVHLNVSLA